MTNSQQERDLWFLLAGAALASSKIRDDAAGVEEHCNVELLRDVFAALKANDPGQLRRVRKCYGLGEGKLLEEIVGRLEHLVGERAINAVRSRAASGPLGDNESFIQNMEVRLQKARELLCRSTQISSELTPASTVPSSASDPATTPTSER